MYSALSLILNPSSLIEDFPAKVVPFSATLIQKFTEYFGVSLDYLIGKENATKETPALTKKDERDIEKKLSETIDMLENSSDGLMFDGEPLDEETKELLRASLQNQFEMTKKLARRTMMFDDDKSED